MAKYRPGPPAPQVVFIKFTPGFDQVDYSIPIDNLFEVQTQLQALQTEARAKDCVLVLQVSLVPEDQFYPSETNEESESLNDNPNPTE